MNVFKELYQNRKLIWKLSKNDFRNKFAGAYFGIIWAFIQPMVTVAVYFVVFQLGLRVQPAATGYPYICWLVSGIIPWFFIQDSITQGAKELRINRQFITKVKFPVSTILTYTEVSRLFVHLILMAFMYAYVLFTIGPSWYNLQFFLYCPLMFIFFLALTWSTAPMSAFSKDFESLIVSVMSGIFWLSGIMYNSYGFDSPFLNKLMLINPINFFVNGYRNCFLYNRPFYANKTECLVFAIEFVVIFALGIFNYNRLRKKLPDVL